MLRILKPNIHFYDLRKELDGFVNKNCRKSKDDDQDESNPEHFDWNFVDEFVPFHSVKIGHVAEFVQPVNAFVKSGDKILVILKSIIVVIFQNE
jgi:hypothetical protein